MFEIKILPHCFCNMIIVFNLCTVWHQMTNTRMLSTTTNTLTNMDYYPSTAAITSPGHTQLSNLFRHTSADGIRSTQQSHLQSYPLLPSPSSLNYVSPGFNRPASLVALLGKTTPRNTFSPPAVSILPPRPLTAVGLRLTTPRNTFCPPAISTFQQRPLTAVGIATPKFNCDQLRQSLKNVTTDARPVIRTTTPPLFESYMLPTPVKHGLMQVMLLVFSTFVAIVSSVWREGNTYSQIVLTPTFSGWIIFGQCTTIQFRSYG